MFDQAVKLCKLRGSKKLVEADFFPPQVCQLVIYRGKYGKTAHEESQ